MDANTSTKSAAAKTCSTTTGSNTATDASTHGCIDAAKAAAPKEALPAAIVTPAKTTEAHPSPSDDSVAFTKSKAELSSKHLSCTNRNITLPMSVSTAVCLQKLQKTDNKVYHLNVKDCNQATPDDEKMKLIQSSFTNELSDACDGNVNDSDYIAFLVDSLSLGKRDGADYVSTNFNGKIATLSNFPFLSTCFGNFASVANFPIIQITHLPPN